MRLDSLPLPPDAVIHGDGSRPVTGVSHDSRTTAPGELYAALPGANVHGARFAGALLAAGVSAVLTDSAGLRLLRESGADTSSAVLIEVGDPRAALGDIAAALSGTRGAPPRLLGITGTNGKTTTTYLLDALLGELGETTGVIGTIATSIAGVRQPSARTTPESPELHRLLAQMRSAGAGWCSMEVSSHALAQHRVDGAQFAVAGFTNLSQDHLDFHPTMEDYFAAKAQLFTPQFSQRGAVVLADDWARRLAREAQIPVVTISRTAADEPDYLVVEDAPGGAGSGGSAAEAAGAEAAAARTPGGGGHFDLVRRTGAPGAEQRMRVASPLPGDFNVMNAALAVVMLLEAGFAFDAVARAAGGFTAAVPGRMEVVSPAGPRAIVDYSHTPDALVNVLSGLQGAPLVAVIGAGGDRDHGKRPLMGRAAAQWADAVIVTDDNPRSEDPAAIRAAVLSGALEAVADGTARAARSDVCEVASRAQAIAEAVRRAGPAGTVLVAGKGHETGQEIAGTVHPFDDREQTREAVARAAGGARAGRVQA
ncbi:UDP-N-acetylmuramoyl-L-alanyl-D-glutamate--2,6-diaminopimelate ligase [Brevibacterium rongguiense]|nr:UDP-N-acetylmuramoyl-L-alanyl-D-glutamate--2,6-diaminopimelate ligase [Brevibacterium rongguiense]